MDTSLSRYIVLTLVATFGATGCQAIGDIFKAGMWVGVLIVGAIAVFIVGAVALAKR